MKIWNIKNKIFQSKNINEVLRNENFSPIDLTSTNDVFVAGYPKSGNTWVQNLIAGILLDSTSSRISPKLVSELIPDVQSKKYFKKFYDNMVFKTHLLPKPEYKRVIHLIRDGRDAMVSYYNMGKNKHENFPFTLRDMIVDGKGVNPTKWYLHTREWSKNPYNSEIIVVRYEDLHNFPEREMRKIVDFLKIEMTDERLMEIFQNNTIDNVRDRVGKYGMNNDHTWKNKPITAFYRRGKVGDYQTQMSDDLVNFFNKEAKKELEFYKYL